MVLVREDHGSRQVDWRLAKRGTRSHISCGAFLPGGDKSAAFFPPAALWQLRCLTWLVAQGPPSDALVWGLTWARTEAGVPSTDLCGLMFVRLPSTERGK